MVNRFKNTMPCLARSCFSSGSRVLTCVFFSIFLCTIWLNATTVYPTAVALRVYRKRRKKKNCRLTMDEKVQSPFDGGELGRSVHDARLVSSLRRSSCVLTAENRKIEVEKHF